MIACPCSCLRKPRGKSGSFQGVLARVFIKQMLLSPTDCCLSFADQFSTILSQHFSSISDISEVSGDRKLTPSFRKRLRKSKAHQKWLNRTISAAVSEVLSTSQTHCAEVFSHLVQTQADKEEADRRARVYQQQRDELACQESQCIERLLQELEVQREIAAAETFRAKNSESKLRKSIDSEAAKTVEEWNRENASIQSKDTAKPTTASSERRKS